MAGDAEILRMTGGATRCDRPPTRRTAGSLRQLAMTAEDKARRVMRAWFGKAGNVFACQSGRVGEPHVTRRACFARDVQVGRIVPVTIDALTDDRVSHGPPRRTAFDMTRGAILDQRAVSRVLRGCCAPVRLVREAPVPRARAGARLPFDSLLDHTVVA